MGKGEAGITMQKLKSGGTRGAEKDRPVHRNKTNSHAKKNETKTSRS